MSVRVLLFDRDSISLAAMRDVLCRAHYDVCCADTVEDAVALGPTVAVAIIDLLSDPSAGLELLSALQRGIRPPACAVTLRFGHDASRAEAMRLGAFECIDQPVTALLLTTLVGSVAAYQRHKVTQPAHSVLHSLFRWADVVVRGVDCPRDPRTLAEWGREVGASTGAIRNWCRTAGLSARRSLLFTRLLRAVIRHSKSRTRPEDLLNVADRRTLAKVLLDAGGSPFTLPDSVGDFLDRQRFIVRRDAIDVIASALSEREAAQKRSLHTAASPSVERQSAPSPVSVSTTTPVVGQPSQPHLRGESPLASLRFGGPFNRAV